jgi:hypothetical protein
MWEYIVIRLKRAYIWGLGGKISLASILRKIATEAILSVVKDVERKKEKMSGRF